MIKNICIKIIKGLAIAIIIAFIICMLFLFQETYRLPFYIFFLLMLVIGYLKFKNPALKTKRLIAFVLTATVPILVWIIWQFQTYEPSNKIYSIDNQYSYYLAKYNYNKIAKYHPFFFFDGASYQYKAYVYDEIEQKMLTSGSVGNIEWNDFCGFSDYDNSFCFTRDDRYWLISPGYYKLPRPIDPKAIEREKEREKAHTDSRLQVKQFDERPAVTIRFKEKKEEITFERKDLYWDLIEGEMPFIIKITSPLLRDMYIFKIPFVAKNMPIKCSIEIEDDKFMFQVVQLSDTIHSDEFFFERNEKDHLWNLTDASHTIYTSQSINEIRKYIFEPNLFTYIDVIKMEEGERYEVERK